MFLKTTASMSLLLPTSLCQTSAKGAARQTEDCQVPPWQGKVPSKTYRDGAAATSPFRPSRHPTSGKMMADSGDRVEDHADALDAETDQPRQDDRAANQLSGPRAIRNDEAHLDPSRWWFASSAFPMIAGTLGPVASAFSICALVRPWRQHFPPGSDIDKAVFVEDPIWLTVVNAIQLAMALVANLILLLNMAKKIKFTIAQPITIVTWYISAILLMALAVTASGPLIEEPQNEYIWSQAFFYGIYAAVLYFFCSSLMVVTFWGALKGHYSKDFQLTTSQRTLMLQTIMFLVYLLIGALVFSRIENWAYLDGVYWADVTLFTVGFGEFSAATPLGRALLFPYALIGVISLGLVVGSIRSLVLERARRQLGVRMVEKKRKQMLRRLVRKGKDDILVPVVTDDDEGDYDEARTTTSGLTEFERRQKEFGLMRKIQAKSERRRRWMAMGISTAVWLVLWLVGAAIFQQCEVRYQGWTYFDGFYFAFVSLTTIGYGDVTPISPAGKSFFVFWSLMALPTMTVLISNAGDTVVKLVREWTDWLGTVTILPSDRGFKKEVKLVMRALSMGTVFGDESDVEESPPGFLGNTEKHMNGHGDMDEEKPTAQEDERTRERSTEEPEDEIDEFMGNESRSARGGRNDATPGESKNTVARTASSSTGSSNQVSFGELPRPTNARKTGSSPNLQQEVSKDSNTSGQSASRTRQQTLPMRRAVSVPRTRADLPRVVPDNRHDYAVVLIDEISRVTQHLKSKPPRKYNFEEWAWFLGLVGEDEGRADTHKKPVAKSRKKRRRKGEQETRGPVDDPEHLQWSWVGSRSPLMGSQEEAEWILEKLEQRLAEELRAMRDEALGKGGPSGR